MVGTAVQSFAGAVLRQQHAEATLCAQAASQPRAARLQSGLSAVKASGLHGSRRKNELVALVGGARASGRSTPHVTMAVAIEGATTTRVSSADREKMKQAAAVAAVKYVKSGMVVGIGTGSTAAYALEEIGKQLKGGKLKDVKVVVTSYQSNILARQYGVPTVSLNDVASIDLAVDGADEIDENKHLIKGGGAAHTMEKVVNANAKQFYVIADFTKLVKKLGLAFPVPVEVLPGALTPVLRALAALGGEPTIRNAVKKDGPVITDLGNMVVDVRFEGGISDPVQLEKDINAIPGVIENGLFVGAAAADKTIYATIENGDVQVLEA
eukprot:jgi/Chlat1/4975/Chrsp32S04957